MLSAPHSLLVQAEVTHCLELPHSLHLVLSMLSRSPSFLVFLVTTDGGIVSWSITSSAVAEGDGLVWLVEILVYLGSAAVQAVAAKGGVLH